MTQLSLSSLNDTVELQGTLERVVFHNEENGYTVFRVRPEGKDEVDLVTVVGHMGSPQAGASLRIKGRWVNNARFGRQVQMDSFESLLPATAEGIKLYLASGLIKGIGKSIAARIVKAFGEDTLRIFDEEPQRLLEISGITQKKLVTIVECWTEHQGVRNLVQFLQPHDIGASFAVRIYKHYGPQALSIVQENPYRLAMDIRGIGFLTADALAAKLGFESEHPLRIQAGTLYTLMKQIDDGHVYYPRRALVEQTCSQLGIAEEFVEEAVDCLAREERVVLEELDDEIGVYLTRFHHYESKIAYYLRRILASPKSVRFPKADEVVEKVVSRLGITLAEEQLEAVRTSATSKVMVLTGGPGTGKTTTTQGIIAALKKAGLRVLLAAPTGRAAKRMSEATGMEAKTIHRLLEYNPQDGYKRNDENPLEGDALIVDECSMIDILLMNNLLKAVPVGMRLVFVGDIDQLPSVGAGNVLRDIIDSQRIPVVRLVRIFRQAQKSRIVMNAHAINQGRFPDTSNGRDTDFFFMREDDPERAAETIVRLVKERLPRAYRESPDRIQVLTPMQRGVVGAANLNLLLQQALNPSGPSLGRGGYTYRQGDRVMQLCNNYAKDVFNGDLGYIREVDTEERTLKVDFDGKWIEYDITELDELTLAYATTIHKAQGSEYPIVVMPVLMTHFVMLQRNLIYTGITRAKKICVLIGATKALAYAVHNMSVLKRNTSLRERLNPSLTTDGKLRG